MTDLANVARALAEDLRDGCLAAYDTIPGAPTPKPSGVVHHDGVIPVIDCGDLLIVMVTSLSTAFQGPSEQCALVPVVGLMVTITRCVPNLTSYAGVASQADLTTAALSLAQDAYTVWHGVAASCMAKTLWTSFQGLSCADTQFRDMRPGALGGIGWWSWNILVNVTAPLV